MYKKQHRQANHRKKKKEISSFNDNKLMKAIHSIDWIKLEALLKK